MSRIYAVAVNTFREAVRDRVLLGILAAAGAILVFTLALAELSLNEQERVVHDIGLASISIFSVVVAVFLGSSLLYKEIERKTLYVILPKPIRRHEFLLGKYFGITLTALVFVSVMGAVQLLVASVQAGADIALVFGVAAGLLAVLGVALYRAADRTSILVPWALLALGVATLPTLGQEVELSATLAQLVLILGEVLILSAVALLFSSFSTPFLTGLFTLGVWLMGRAADDMATMNPDVVPVEVVRVMGVLAEILPNLNLYYPGRHTLTTIAVDVGGPWQYVATSMAYSVVYSAVVLVVAAFIFRRRDFL